MPAARNRPPARRTPPRRVALAAVRRQISASVQRSNVAAGSNGFVVVLVFVQSQVLWGEKKYPAAARSTIQGGR